MGSILKVLEQQHAKAMKNHWYESYWMIDFHGVISNGNYELDEPTIDFPAYAKESLLILSQRDDIRVILHTSSYPDQIMAYVKLLAIEGIHFDYINENPEIRSYEDFGFYEHKSYFDVYLDDKAGFDVEEWAEIYDFLMTAEIPKPEWINENRRRMSPTSASLQDRRVTSNVKEQLNQEN